VAQGEVQKLAAGQGDAVDLLKCIRKERNTERRHRTASTSEIGEFPITIC
jgi:hypothetical protein